MEKKVMRNDHQERYFYNTGLCNVDLGVAFLMELLNRLHHYTTGRQKIRVVVEYDPDDKTWVEITALKNQTDDHQ